MSAYIPPYAGIYFVPDFNHPAPQWLPQVDLSSVTKLYHTASHTLLTQTFVNPSSVSPISSAKYTFPLYESGAIVAFRCYVGRRLIEGIIKEKEDASATYQAAIGRNEPASLLEQHTADVFTTSIGNIPASETVKVEIKYIMELKHDAEVDGLRFTIPTSIAPRYGALPSTLSGSDTSGTFTARNMNISVQVTMSSNINSIQSPSHPISLHLGVRSTDTPDSAFNPQHALVTLGQTTTELGKDFILLIKCANLSSPTALLEQHPTTPNSQALMVTLVPKFNFPISTKPEVVFIVDRSGSMSCRVAPLKSSLSVFLKSLPLDVNFNICSFGSHHSFLWDQSRPYSNQSFAEAQAHCNSMTANFGGTEVLPAIKSTIERRLTGLNLEIMVLTDGQVWNTEDLFKYVEKETEKGDVRLFSLGIGQDVSHSLIDGLARVGRGFSQVVSDERESMESKVTRMLRGALSAHVINYRLEWEGKPSVEVLNSSSITRATGRISLFDSHANPDSPVSFTSPTFTIPSVIQAPYKIQPLFPFSRSTAYALLSSSEVNPPSHVWLRGTTPEGVELELEIAVQRVPEPGETIHQLAARKILQELKDGTSYVHDAVDKARQPGLLAEWVKKEGVRVGLNYRVASHWTSFVAVERRAEEAERQNQDESPLSGLDDEEEWDTVTDAERDSDGGPPAAPIDVGGAGGGAVPVVPVMMMMAPPPPPIPYPTKKHESLSSKLFGSSPKSKSAKTGMYDYPDYLTSKGSASDLSNFKSGVSSSSFDDDGWNTVTKADSPSGTVSDVGGAIGGFSAPAKALPPAPPLYPTDKRRKSFKSLGFVAPPPPAPVIRPSVDKSYGPVNPRPLIGSTGKGLEQEEAKKSFWTAPRFSLQQQQQMKSSASKPISAPIPTQVTQPSPQSAPQHLGSSSAVSESSSSTPFTGAAPGGMFEAFSSLEAKKTGSVPGPEPIFEGQAYSSSGLLPRPAGARKLFGISSLSKKTMSSTPDIGISYSPSSAPPPERLSADTGSIQPLSSRTKSLIGLQTFDGCFVLDSALATLLGVPISVLEARLTMTMPKGVPGLSPEERNKVWATVLAIKLFETQLAGEQSVWQLVVDKARAWVNGLAGVRDVISQLEKLAGEVLGV